MFNYVTVNLIKVKVIIYSFLILINGGLIMYLKRYAMDPDINIDPETRKLWKKQVEDWRRTHRQQQEENPEISEEFKKMQKPRDPQETPEALLKDRAKGIKENVKDLVVQKPGSFLNSLNKVIDLVKNMEDPKKHGLLQDLNALQNDISPKIRKDIEIKIPAKNQEELVDTAVKLEESAPLLTLFSNLFQEKYAPRREYKTALLRRIAAEIYGIIPLAYPKPL
jgi:hypothetical protein